jgi:hypothetical protein
MWKHGNTVGRVLALVILLSLGSSGCVEINRAAAKLAGCKGDIYGNPPTCTAPPPKGATP